MGEHEVRDLLERAGAGITVAGQPPSHVLSSARRGRQTRVVAQLVGVAGLVLAVVIGSLAWRAGGGSADAPVADGQQTVTTPALAAPPGQRLVGANGAYVAVPEGWATEQVACPNTTSRDTVSLFVQVPDSPFCEEPYPAATTLQVGRLDSPLIREVVAAAGPTRVVDGLEVATTPITGVGVSGGPFTGGLVLPEQDLVLALYSPDRAGLQEILDSLRAVPAGYATVPVVPTDSVAAAQQALTDAGLASDVTEVNRPAVAAGTLLGSRPKAGTVVAEESVATVLVAGGEPSQPRAPAPTRLTCESDRRVSGTLDYLTWPSDPSPYAAALSFAELGDGESVVVTEHTGRDATAYILRPDGTARTRFGVASSAEGWFVETFVRCAGEG